MRFSLKLAQSAEPAKEIRKFQRKHQNFVQEVTFWKNALNGEFKSKHAVKELFTRSTDCHKH
jgi:hypothetical protein